MKFLKDDKERLKELGVSSLLDLALILPKNYDDLSIKEFPNEGNNTVEIECGYSTKNQNMLVISSFCITWNLNIKVIVFNYKPWHFGAFKKGKRIFINAKSSNFNGVWQFVNPKIIQTPNTILPKYKIQKINDKEILKFINKYINLNSLLDEGLKKDEANLLLKIHENSQKSIEIIKNLENNSENLRILKFVEIFNYLKKLRKKKTILPSKVIEAYDISSWLKTLPFTPTNDQLKAIEDIRLDLLSQNAKKRVVMGDVGSGKTLIILACALMMYPRICYLMAPTSVLAEQIYNEALRLLPKFLKTILIKSGEKNINFNGVNFVVGTHALLFQKLPSSSLVMIDEQHRFGLNQRESIFKEIKDGEFYPNSVQFSATPIPRTLSLIQSEMVDFSFLKEIPYKKDIKTLILQSDGFSSLISHIKDEISKNKQVAIIYPLVEENESSHYQSLNEAKDFWQKEFKNVMITHGKDAEKEDILKDFSENGDILLSTTIVEVGISLPRLSTIVIVGAERFGLATLHQLRGRVARNGGVGYCYLFTKLKKPPQRLYDFANTLDGFKVAEMDLKNRQSGDILDGKAQHGQTFFYYNMEQDLVIEAKERL